MSERFPKRVPVPQCGLVTGSKRTCMRHKETDVARVGKGKVPVNAG